MLITTTKDLIFTFTLYDFIYKLRGNGNMAYSVYHSTTFNTALEKFPKEFKLWLDKIEEQLVQNPYVGAPLQVPWFREKKHGKYRAYYLIYEDLKAVYFVGMSDKKDQQKSINTIFMLLEYFKEEIRNLVKR